MNSLSATSKCEKEAEGVNTGNAFLRGAFTPQCRDDGFYEKKQCHSSTGYCWCVGITTGREILGTRKAPGRGSPSCGEYITANEILRLCKDISFCNPCCLSVENGKQ